MCGYPSIGVRTVQEAERTIAQLGPEAVVLVVIDTNVLGTEGADIQHEAHQFFQTWSGQDYSLPVVFLGDVLQKYAILAARLALVPFVTFPVSPHDLMQTVQPLLPDRGQRHLRSPFPQTGLPDWTQRCDSI